MKRIGYFGRHKLTLRESLRADKMKKKEKTKKELNDLGRHEMKMCDDAGLPYPKCATDRWYDEVEDEDALA